MFLEESAMEEKVWKREREREFFGSSVWKRVCGRVRCAF